MIAGKEAEMAVMSFRRLYDLLTNMSRYQAFFGVIVVSNEISQEHH